MLKFKKFAIPNLFSITAVIILKRGKNMREKGLIDIYILEILAEYSSERHRLIQKDILYYLDVNYMLKVDRNTLSGYLSELKSKGYICGDRGVYLKRKFSNGEIKGIINSILYTKAMPADTVKRLIGILKGMAEPDIRNKLYSTYFVNGINYIENKNINDVIETIDEAIYRKKKIQYIGCRYDIDGKLKETDKRIVNPYYIVVEKSRPYLLCYTEKRDGIEPRRIDRISRVKILEDSRIEIDQIDKYKGRAFNAEDYMKEHIYMYSGESEFITVKIEREHIGDFIDWFGKDYMILQNDDEIVVRIKANVNAVFFWALQYSGIAEVLCPASLRQRINEEGLKIAEKYSGYKCNKIKTQK